MLEDVAAVLLQKNIPFALYRVPNAIKTQLAVDEELSRFADEGRFVIAPFQTSSSSKKIILFKIADSADRNALRRAADEMDKRSVALTELPTQTSKQSFIDSFHTITDYMQSQGLSKAVLSRVLLINKPEAFSALSFFKKLRATYPAAFVHLFYHPSSGVWAGATPELLLHRNGNRVTTMALAGTQKKHEGEYRWGEKEMEEHRLLYDHIESVFNQHHCILRSKSASYTVEAAAVAHLRTDFEFDCTLETEFEQLVDEYHPTPAVAGLPVNKSIEAIALAEKHRRAYYSGYLGEITGKRAELFVNLRCVQIGESQLAVYVGGGITAGSLAEAEWNETIIKSKTMVDVINRA